MRPALLVFFLSIVITPINSFAQEIDKLDGDSAEQVTESPKPDMTELFGPDYKKGDIGHSFGVIKAMTDADTLVIEHGKIHGTDIEAKTTEFEVLNSAGVPGLIENSQVEFLVKRGHDNEYRLLSICMISAGSSKCL